MPILKEEKEKDFKENYYNNYNFEKSCLNNKDLNQETKSLLKKKRRREFTFYEEKEKVNENDEIWS